MKQRKYLIRSTVLTVFTGERDFPLGILVFCVLAVVLRILFSAGSEENLESSLEAQREVQAEAKMDLCWLAQGAFSPRRKYLSHFMVEQSV
jgi:hypothetical protein